MTEVGLSGEIHDALGVGEKRQRRVRGNRILPGTSRRNEHLLDAQTRDALREPLAIDTVAVSQGEASANCCAAHRAVGCGHTLRRFKSNPTIPVIAGLILDSKNSRDSKREFIREP